MDPWTPLGKEDSPAWEEKRVPPRSGAQAQAQKMEKTNWSREGVHGRGAILLTLQYLEWEIRV